MGTHPIFESDFDCLTDGEMESDVPHIVNLINSVIGVGILAMPFCMSQCGLILGTIVLLFCGFITLQSCLMLISSAKAKNKTSYEYLASACFGSVGKFSIEFAQIGLMLGTCIAFYIVISSLLVEVFADIIQSEPTLDSREELRRQFCLFLGFFIVLPLGLLRNMSSIAFFAYFSSGFYVIFIAVVIYRSALNGLFNFEWIQEIDLFIPSGIFKVLPIFALAYTCQSQLFIIYASMDNPPITRIRSIMVRMISIVGAVYALIGVLGYSMFKSDIKGNMLLNYESDFLLKMIKFGFALSVVVGFPLMIYPCRQSIFTLFLQKSIKYTSLNDSDSTYIPPSVFRSLTLGIVTGTMIVAILIQNVETILGLNGALMGTFIAFILPSLCYSKILTKNSSQWDRQLCNFVLMIGIASMGLGIIQNLPSMPLDDQWETIQNWEERHDALETHLESVGPVKKSIQPEVEPEVPEAVGIQPEVLPDLSGMLARKIGDNIQKYPKPAEQNS